MKLKYFINISFLLSLLLFMNACDKEEYAIPTLSKNLQNDVIKRSLGPNVIGQQIEFAYAMAMGPEVGKIVSAQVEASIAGAPGTFLENRSFYTNTGGADVGVIIGEASVTNGKTTKVTFTADTCAATLRYYYVVPEEARGKSVSFTFSTISSNEQTASYSMGPYTISKMDMVLGLDLSDNNACYISIADMAVYNEADAAANADKIDLLYLYRTTPANFTHALVSPAADAIYLPGITLPSGVNRSTKVSKVWNLRDWQLDPRHQYSVFVDDLDFQELDLSGAPNYALNLKEEAGIWVETADGKYRAYIFINSINNSTKSARIGIKRYAL